jgi:hypothetical protein
MVIETAISIWGDGNAAGSERQLELVDALADFAKSRATRRLFREAKASNIQCDLRVPLLNNCRVCPDELARALRKVYRAVIDGAEPGERFTIDLIKSDSQLAVQAMRRGSAES